MNSVCAPVELELSFMHNKIQLLRNKMLACSVLPAPPRSWPGSLRGARSASSADLGKPKSPGQLLGVARHILNCGYYERSLSSVRCKRCPPGIYFRGSNSQVHRQFNIRDPKGGRWGQWVKVVKGCKLPAVNSGM